MSHEALLTQYEILVSHAASTFMTLQLSAFK